jgi:DNA-directed RNA polymerase sigma subunit (sigma70/sigma32)
VEKYRPGTGRFALLATYWIKHSVWRAIDNQSRTVRLPVELIKLCRNGRRRRRRWLRGWGISPVMSKWDRLSGCLRTRSKWW